jgi:hypothetical protein
MWTIVDERKRFVEHKYNQVKPEIEQPQCIIQSYFAVRQAFEKLGYLSALSDKRHFPGKK